MRVCGAALSDDYYEGVHCEAPLGHEGPHRCYYEWDQAQHEIDQAQCDLHGHIWGEWKPYEPPKSSEMANDIADLLLFNMLHTYRSLGSFTETHPLTKTRNCKRCNAYDNDREFKFEPQEVNWGTGHIYWTEEALAQGSGDVSDDHLENSDTSKGDGNPSTPRP